MSSWRAISSNGASVFSTVCAPFTASILSSALFASARRFCWRALNCSALGLPVQNGALSAFALELVEALRAGATASRASRPAAARRASGGVWERRIGISWGGS
jgi:hypothetical protein